MNSFLSKFFTPQIKSILNAPSSVYSFFECVSVNPAKIGPFHHCLCFAIKFNEMISSCIDRLFSFRSPTTIFRTIAFVIIYTINRMFGGWLFTHIFDKIINRIAPAITNFYTSTSIVLKLFRLFIITSPYHRIPRSIFRRRCKIVITSFTPTGLYSAIFEVPTIDHRNIPACTAALPMPISFDKSYVIDNCEIIERFSYKIFKFATFSAGFAVATIKAVCASYRGVSTLTSTKPMRFSIFCGVVFDDSKLPVDFTDKIRSVVSFFRHENILQAGCKRFWNVVAGRSAWIPTGELPLATTTEIIPCV